MMLMGAAVFSSCSKPPAPAPAPAPAPVITKGPAEQTYTLRGRLIRLPAPPRQYLVIHHEPLPTFINRQGKQVGMDEMEMDFAWVASPAVLSGLAEGDEIEFTFEVRWHGEPPYLVTHAARLPEGQHANIRELP